MARAPAPPLRLGAIPVAPPATRKLEPVPTGSVCSPKDKDFYVLCGVQAGQFRPDHVPPISYALFHPHRLRHGRPLCQERPFQPGEHVGASLRSPCAPERSLTTHLLPVPASPAFSTPPGGAACQGQRTRSPGPFAPAVGAIPAVVLPVTPSLSARLGDLYQAPAMGQGNLRRT